MRIRKRLAALVFAATLMTTTAQAAPPGIMTPYAEYLEPESFVSGATFILEHADDYQEWITSRLESMKSHYNINTVGLYGLEDFSDEYKGYLFSELVRLGMKAVVRIEAYDAPTFAFTAENVTQVMEYHAPLIEFVSQPERRQAVAYFALNMPVDDEIVQDNLGGVNSAMSKANQVSYATQLVRRMREETARHGFDDAQLYISVFYGWDNAYQVPSYKPAGADGYFINNYTYPQGRSLPDASADGEKIINAERLRTSMDTFISQYGDAPYVIECGYHTLEYNGGEWPGQTAGLVRDREAKQKALSTVVSFYRDNYPSMRGLLYFGYNLYKEEGTPAVVLDWTLVYPTRGIMEAATAAPLGNATVGGDGALGYVMKLSSAGDGAMFQSCPPVQQIAITYTSNLGATLGMYSQGKLRKTVVLNAADSPRTLGVPLTVVEGYNLEIMLEKGDADLLTVGFYGQLEAELAAHMGAATATNDEQAMSGGALNGIDGRENRAMFYGVRGGGRLAITYKSPSDVLLSMESDGKIFTLDLPASPDYTTLTATVTIGANTNVGIYTNNASFTLDCIKMTGTPGRSAVAGVYVQEDEQLATPLAVAPVAAPQAQAVTQPKAKDYGPMILAICSGVAALVAAVPIVVKLKK